MHIFKKVLLVIVIIAIAWIAVFLLRLRYYSNKAGKVIERAERYEKEGDGLRILVLGDSLAYGTGTTAPQKSVAGLLGQRFPSASLENRGRNGLRTNDLANEVKDIDDHYDLIFIIIGGNDAIRPWVDLKESSSNLKTIYGAASSHADHVVALTTGNLKYTSLFLWPSNLYFGYRSEFLRDQAKDIADDLENVTYIDMVARNETHQFDHLKEAEDRLHLSDDGAKYWFEAITDQTNNFEKIK